MSTGSTPTCPGERALCSPTYEHLYPREIDDGPTLAVKAEHYLRVFNHWR